MIDISKIDLSGLDRPEILMFLFHPRPEWGASSGNESRQDLMIPVEPGVEVGARFHMADPDAPNILFFHGNGEIVADYDDMGPLYTQRGINFMPVDYRGYGRSTGNPTVTGMMRDAHVVWDYVTAWLRERGCRGPVVVMGRSLGSAPALELAGHYQDRVAGLIIESGFARIEPLLRLFGLSLSQFGMEEKDGPRNMEKIQTYMGPTLIIHAERDHLIPFEEGKALYESSASTDRTLIMIPGADHNDIFFRGFHEYMEGVERLVSQIGRAS